MGDLRWTPFAPRPAMRSRRRASRWVAAVLACFVLSGCTSSPVISGPRFPRLATWGLPNADRVPIMSVPGLFRQRHPSELAISTRWLGNEPGAVVLTERTLYLREWGPGVGLGDTGRYRTAAQIPRSSIVSVRFVPSAFGAHVEFEANAPLDGLTPAFPDGRFRFIVGVVRPEGWPKDDQATRALHDLLASSPR